MQGDAALTRRTLLAAGFALVPMTTAWAQTSMPPKKRISFDVWRNGQMIGTHSVEIEGDASDLKVRSDVAFLVKFGPIPVLHYRFQSRETWRDGQFSLLESHAQTNGRLEQVHASKTGSAVTIQTAHGQTHIAPADALPLSHWNERALRNPLFNPQTGAMLKEQLAREAAEPLRLPDGRAIQAVKYTLAGETEIMDWYDEAGDWVALRGRIKDGSYLDYRLKV